MKLKKYVAVDFEIVALSDGDVLTTSGEWSVQDKFSGFDSDGSLDFTDIWR